jgi:NAD(P)-dependent dehydrogenase (short-subunit alcohol dehydrogenase family)
VDRSVWVRVFAGEHERQQLTRTSRETGVGAGQRDDPGVERRGRGAKGGAEFGTQPLVAPLRQCVEERLAVGEMPTRSPMADAGRPGQFPERQGVDALLFEGYLRLFQEDRAQVAVVVGLHHDTGYRCPALNVGIDIFVVIAYIEGMTTSRWTAVDLPDMHGRTAIVTGANSGIGRVAALELARAGAAVTLAVRDTNKGDAAAAAMPGDVTVRQLDLADLGSVRSFAEATQDPVDLLVDNAGIMATPEQRTAEGFELQVGTNHLGHFALTNLLLPQITDRVVVVSSDLHRNGKIDLEDLNWERRSYKPWAAYSQSKLANLLFVLELERRLTEAGSAVRAVAVHPGYAATNLQGRTGNPISNLVGAIGNRLIAQSDTMGALPTLFAATADIPGGTYIGPDGFRHLRGHPAVDVPAKQALDAATARRLWNLSEQLTGASWTLSPLTSS